MQTKQADSEKLGEVVAAAYAVSSAITSDRTTAAELAPRHLERVLDRGCNARLVAALRGLARELAPMPVRTVRPSARDAAWAPARLAVAR